jgi:trans-aconitate methyltransferase
MSALDLGCGTGDDVRAISKIVGPSGSAYGVDASAAMIAEARRSALDIAVSTGALSGDEAATWLRSLLEAERRGEFFCAMTNVAVLATA